MYTTATKNVRNFYISRRDERGMNNLKERLRIKRKTGQRERRQNGKEKSKEEGKSKQENGKERNVRKGKEEKKKKMKGMIGQAWNVKQR